MSHPHCPHLGTASAPHRGPGHPTPRGWGCLLVVRGRPCPDCGLLFPSLISQGRAGDVWTELLLLPGQICPRSCLQCRRPTFNPWVGKIPWRRDPCLLSDPYPSPVKHFLLNWQTAPVWREGKVARSVQERGREKSEAQATAWRRRSSQLAAASRSS